MRTASIKPAEVERAWHLVDADGQSLGRLASRVARVLMGKHKPSWTPHVDCGDFVVVVNCDKVRVTGNKRNAKEYDHYTGYPSGRKVRSFEEVMEKDSGEVVRLAVRRMLPKTKLGRQMLTKLKTATGADHKHQAQQPVPLELQ